MKLPFETRRRDIIWFGVIQVILTLVVGFSTVFPGCNEKLEEKPARLGPQVSLDEVADAYIVALEGRSLDSLHVDDAALYEDNVRVQTGAVTLRNTYDRVVKAIEDLPDKTRIVIDQIATDYVSYPEPKQNREDILVDLAKSTSVQKAMSLAEPGPPGGADRQVNGQSGGPFLEVYRTRKEFAALEARETFHNLKVRQATRPAPSRVQQHETCKDLPQCQLQVTEVSFTYAVWNGDKLQRRFDITTALSSQVPFLWPPVLIPLPLPVVEECAKYLVEADDRKYFVSECLVLRDFENAPTSP